MSLDATRLPNQAFVPLGSDAWSSAAAHSEGASRSRQKEAHRRESEIGTRPTGRLLGEPADVRAAGAGSPAPTRHQHRAHGPAAQPPLTGDLQHVSREDIQPRAETTACVAPPGVDRVWNPPPRPFLLNPGCGARTEASPDGGVGVGDFLTSGCVSALRKQSVPIPHLYFQSAGCLTRLRPCLRCSGGREMPSTVRKLSPNSVKSNHHTSWSLFSFDQKPPPLFSI